MISEKNRPTYRQRRSWKKEQVPKKYRGTYELNDEATGQVAACCDLIGRAMFAGLEVYDADAKLWQLRANRRIMPTRWVLNDPSDKVVLQFDQKVLGKLINPLYRVVFTLLDAEDRERYRMVDPRASIPDRIMSIHIGDWPLLEGERPVAKMTALARESQKPSKGLLGKLKNLVQHSDRGFVSVGDAHLLPAPAVLALLLLFDEVTDTSGVE
jgi:hypothetical protein